MRGIRLYAIVAAAFMAGAFIASPQLRAYAANTVGSADIINNSIKSVDIKDGEVKTVDLGGSAVTSAKIKDGEVKTVDIATGAVAAGRIADGAVGTLKIADDSITAADIQADAVGASGIAGVTKLIFEQCKFVTPNVPAGSQVIVQCSSNSVDNDDSAIATMNHDGIGCLEVHQAIPSSGSIGVSVRNVYGLAHTFVGDIGVIVFDK